MKHAIHTLGTLLVTAALTAGTVPVLAQAPQVTNQEILNELKAIRQMLEALNARLGMPPTAPAGDRRVTLGPATGPMLGRADAPLTMVEFTDLQCPFCRQFHMTAFEELKRNYIDTGKLRYFSRDYPIESLHPLAMAATRASSCAADQQKFWEMRHLILAGNQQLRRDSFAAFALELKLDLAAFQMCTADPDAHKAQLSRDMADAQRLGINGTPSFAVGRTSSTGLDGILIVGALPYAAFDAKLKALLAEVR